MITTCPHCHLRYNDASRWTICPHNSIDVGAHDPYCRQHDRYNCTLCALRPLSAVMAEVSKKVEPPKLTRWQKFCLGWNKFFLCKCLDSHELTSAALEGISPTKDQLDSFPQGFWDYAKMWCKRCGKESRLSKAERERHGRH